MQPPTIPLKRGDASREWPRSWRVWELERSLTHLSCGCTFGSNQPLCKTLTHISLPSLANGSFRSAASA